MHFPNEKPGTAWPSRVFSLSKKLPNRLCGKPIREFRILSHTGGFWDMGFRGFFDKLKRREAFASRRFLLIRMAGVLRAA